MKHEEHICRFNDGKQSCDCYDAGYEESQKDRWESKCGGCGTHPSFWKTIVQSDEWRRWRVEQNQRMHDFPSEKSMYDMDECTELGIISENHWKSFIKFIKQIK